MLREELQLLQEQGSYVGEVVRAMDKKKVLVKVSGRTICGVFAGDLFVPIFMLPFVYLGSS